MQQKPQPGSKSETASAARDVAGGLAATALAGAAVSVEAFADRAMVATLYELQAAAIALQRTRREDVRQFAQRMIDDHDRVRRELNACLGGTEVANSVPDQVDSLHQGLLDDLAGASDQDFDHRYIQQQRLAHTEAITLFQTYLQLGQDPALQNLCRITLPVVEEHARIAQQLASH